MHKSKWLTQLAAGVALILTLLFVPSVLRTSLSGWVGYVCGILLTDAIGFIIVSFITNNERLAGFLFLASNSIEFLLIHAGVNPRVTVWFGDLVPVIVGVHYTKKLYVNMGD